MPNLLTLGAALAAGAAVMLLLPAVPHQTRSGRTRLWCVPARWRCRPQGRVAGDAEAAALLDLTAALLSAGVGIEASLLRLAKAVPGAEPLAGVHRSLAAGASWDQAAELVSEHPPLREFCDHLSFAYTTGAPSARMLQAAATRARAERRHTAEAAAEKLGVSMMLPLGACFLPAFILLGVVPVVVSMLPEALGM
ncbi:type II secretion system F family protein [Nesterenkonia muleiensis]|uniref:type II secretion system F family protein n=1 Tax=Nesterenkonia muleiensis TaxID=2282648 RepID=UPI000E7544FD|nr:type II secretion system F family protein [Nesterenkonia muleiensis]